MVLLTSELMNALAILADNEELKVTLKQSGKGGLICGAMCMIGGFIGGPPGLLVGGALGSIVAFTNGKGMRQNIHISCFAGCISHIIKKIILPMFVTFFFFYFSHKGTFKPVSDVIRFDLTVAQQERLRDHMEVFVQNLDIQDAVTLVAIFGRSPAMQAQVLKTLVNFVQNELHHHIAAS